MSKFKCNLCNYESNIGRSVENHIFTDHMISYRNYYERFINIPTHKCNKCNGDIYPLNAWTNTLINSCTKCDSQYFKSLMKNIDSWYSYLLDDSNYSRLWVLNRKYRDMMTVNDFRYYDELINSIIKSRCTIYDNINLFSIKIREAYPMVLDDPDGIVITDSLTNIKVNELTPVDENSRRFSFQCGGKSLITLEIPELYEYDKNHYRYNILKNFENNKLCKKLFIHNIDKCIKFYNSGLEGCKSILKLSKNGDRTYPHKLTDEELYYTKYYIMTNPVILKFIMIVARELIQFSYYSYDSALILNKLFVGKGKYNLLFGWTGMDNINRDRKSNNTISVSII